MVLKYFSQLHISEWKSKGMSKEIIKPPTTSDNNLPLSYIGNKVRAKFVGSSLEQDKITFTHGAIVNINIVYEASVSVSNSSYPTSVKSSLFGAVKVTKNADIDKYKYSGYRLDLIDVQLFHFLVVDLVEM